MTLADVLRRAKVEVTVLGVGIKNEVAVCSRGVKIAPDVKFEETNIKAVWIRDHNLNII